MLEIKKLARIPLPPLPYEKIAADALGRDFDVSLVTIGNTRSRTLNRTRRGKDKPTNVLSFPLSQKDGEMFLDLSIIRREAKRQGDSFADHLLLIFIHGLFHLVGLDHGSIMENKERKLLSRWRAKLSHRLM